MNLSITAKRFAYLGFAIGLAAMVAMFIVGAVNGSAPMMVASSSGGAGVGSAWAAAWATFNRKATASTEAAGR